MITIKKNEIPKLSSVKFNVDVPLNNKLNDFELTKLLNKHNFSLFLGKAGSGKSSLMISFLKSKALFKKVYHTIILFCPPNSRSSINGDFWSKNLPEEQIYDELTFDNLKEAYITAKSNSEDGLKTLIIMDDVQKNLKNECEKLLLDIVNNRRHNMVSIWLLCQNYRSIPKQVRMALTNLIVFKVSKSEANNIFEEQIEAKKDVFEEILKVAYKKPHEFLFIDTNTQRIFLNWDELLLNDE